jgi:hypothetical protein
MTPSPEARPDLREKAHAAMFPGLAMGSDCRSHMPSDQRTCDLLTAALVAGEADREALQRERDEAHDRHERHGEWCGYRVDHQRMARERDTALADLAAARAELERLQR